MRVDLFDFELPEEAIALRPAVPRHAAKMLIVDPNGEKVLTDRSVIELADQLRSGDALVFNNTKVIPAQLEGTRSRIDYQGNQSTISVSATLHMRVAANEWRAFLKPGKRIKIDDVIVFCGDDGSEIMAKVTDKGERGDMALTFDCSGADLDEAIARIGHIPLPPYIASKRGEDAQDRSDYQTIYAKEKGAVAAPTAGLHFTDEVFEALDAKGISRHFVTLHVGAGTFLPVKVDDTDAHKMHSEIGYVSPDIAQALNEVKAKGGRVVCVGTTSMRLLESASDEDGQLREWSGATDIFITPGYRFKFVDVLMTNFHLPKSTLFMLVSAFCGLETMQKAYHHAIENAYRFYSYGDSSLLFKKDS